MPVYCPNCEKEVIGTYCHHCGQPSHVKRLTLRVFLSDLQQRVFGFDSKFTRTLKDLTIRPGTVIKTVVEGVKVRYVGPLGYYFVLLTIYTLLISFLDIDMETYTHGISKTISPDPNERQAALQHTINGYVYGNIRLFSFLLLPFIISGTWLIFRNKKFNYLETAGLVFYGMGHPILLSVFSLFLYKYWGLDGSVMVIMWMSYLYFAFVCMDFYTGNKLWNFVKGILSLVIGYVLMMLVVLFVFVLIAIFQPDLVDSLTSP